MPNVITLAGILLAVAAVTPSLAAESYDGLWARTQKDCRNQEGFDSKTHIDMSKPIGNKKDPPMVDQYENHCRIDRKAETRDGLTLGVTCYEFWDDYKKNIEPRKATYKLAQGPNGTIKIDGKSYLRCKMPKDAGKR